MSLEPRTVVLRMVEMFATGDLAELSSIVSADYQGHQESDLGTAPEVFALVVT
jgi:hypothetical protein